MDSELNEFITEASAIRQNGPRTPLENQVVAALYEIELLRRHHAEVVLWRAIGRDLLDIDCTCETTQTGKSQCVRCEIEDLLEHGPLQTKDTDQLLPPVEHNDGKSCLQRMTDGFFTNPDGEDNG